MEPRGSVMEKRGVEKFEMKGLAFFLALCFNFYCWGVSLYPFLSLLLPFKLSFLKKLSFCFSDATGGKMEGDNKFQKSEKVQSDIKETSLTSGEMEAWGPMSVMQEQKAEEHGNYLK